MDIAGKTMVITGAGQGLGQAIAVALSERGARLVLWDQHAEGLEHTSALCKPHAVHTAVVDVTQEQAVIHGFEAAVARWGSVDALVNNAGIVRDHLLVQARDDQLKRMPLSDWRAVIEVNLTGVFLCGREAAYHMIQHHTPGAVINMASIGAAGHRGQSNYAAAKAGVVALTVTWAQEWARHGIRAVAVAPGFMDTAMTAGMPPAALQRVVERIPCGQLGRPEQVAHTVVFALENDYINGRVIACDGGLRL